MGKLQNPLAGPVKSEIVGKSAKGKLKEVVGQPKKMKSMMMGGK